MSKEELSSLVDEMLLYRPYYKKSVGENGIRGLKINWWKQLQNYSYEDVKERLNEFFRDEKNDAGVPNPYRLRDGLLTEEIKEKQSKYKVACMFCGRWLDGNEIQKHEKRCRSIKYLSNLCLKYFQRDIGNKPELYDMSEDLFNKSYVSTLQKMLGYVNENERKGIENVVNSYLGKETNYSVSEL